MFVLERFRCNNNPEPIKHRTCIYLTKITTVCSSQRIEMALKLPHR